MHYRILLAHIEIHVPINTWILRELSTVKTMEQWRTFTGIYCDQRKKMFERLNNAWSRKNSFEEILGNTLWRHFHRWTQRRTSSYTCRRGFCALKWRHKPGSTGYTWMLLINASGFLSEKWAWSGAEISTH